PNAYTADRTNGATLLTIPFGHTVDALCHCLGEFTQVDALMANRRKSFTLVPEGKEMPMTTEDQVVVSGLLANGAVASIHYRGGASRGTNMLWEINGTEGDLQISGDAGHAQMFPLTLKGARGEDQALQVLEIPAEYQNTPALESMVAQNVAEAYQRVYSDLTEGTQLCPTFDEAVVRHRLLQAIETSAEKGTRQSV
ncbi:MAG: Gfo/Idh/MocA family oxidoreductase, partial [Tissierellales bacterium]